MMCAVTVGISEQLPDRSTEGRKVEPSWAKMPFRLPALSCLVPGSDDGLLATPG